MPFEWCLARQKQVLGFWWWVSRGLVYRSARKLKREMDEQRAKDRAVFSLFRDPEEQRAKNRALLLRLFPDPESTAGRS